MAVTNNVQFMVLNGNHKIRFKSVWSDDQFQVKNQSSNVHTNYEGNLQSRGKAPACFRKGDHVMIACSGSRSNEENRRKRQFPVDFTTITGTGKK